MYRVIFKTTLGLYTISWNYKGIISSKLLGDRDATYGEDTYLASRQEIAPNEIREAIQAIQKHLSGELQDLSIFPLDFSGVSKFFINVYKQAQKIPPGSTLTYSQLAIQAGSPKAARAVGQAMARNPYLLFVPCHRVIGASNKLGGFSAPGGIRTKQALLYLEIS